MTTLNDAAQGASERGWVTRREVLAAFSAALLARPAHAAVATIEAGAIADAPARVHRAVREDRREAGTDRHRYCPHGRGGRGHAE